MTAYPHEYSLYGLTVRSNRPLPGAPPPRGDAAGLVVDFAGRLEDTETLGSPFLRARVATLWHLDAATWLLRFFDSSDPRAWVFRASEGGGRLTVTWADDRTLPQIAPVLHGIGMALALHLRSAPLLHACVIAVGGAAIAVIGPSGAGKSTTAAAFVRGGFALLSDDIAALIVEGDTVTVHPGYQQLRLMADLARSLGWNPQELPRMPTVDDQVDKRLVPLAAAGGTFCPRSLPLRAIYMLRPRQAGNRATFETLTRRAALPQLMHNVFLAHCMDDIRRAAAWRSCAQLAATVPVRTVVPTDSLAALPCLVEALVADAADLDPIACAQ
jgi:hypothetical protein